MSILIYIPFSTNTGYAIKSLESSFYRMACKVFDNDHKIHFLYKNLNGGVPKSLPETFSNIISIDNQPSPGKTDNLCRYIKDNSISVLFGLDLPVTHLFYKPFRRAGLKKIVSYWGAPTGDIASFYKLWFNRIGVYLYQSKPDHFIFESCFMARTAVYGRGIPSSRVSIVNLGVDTEKYLPSENRAYAYTAFDIPSDRRIIFYSGHMEERKGVHILVKAAAAMVNDFHRYDVHFLIAGNKEGEESRFHHLYHGTRARNHITFAGYRDDLPKIIPCCHIGVIASTGWDSFTVSALEMASCGLPIIVSNLQGLTETIDDTVTGFLFKPGEHIDLCAKINLILDDPSLQKSMSRAARTRIVQKFTSHHQIENLSNTLKMVMKKAGIRNGSRI